MLLKVYIITAIVYIILLFGSFTIYSIFFLLFLLSPILNIWFYINKKNLPLSTCDSDNLKIIEKNGFDEIKKKYNLNYEIINIPEKFLHVIKIFKNKEVNKNILIIHGMHSGPLAFSNILNSLLDLNHNIYLLSLPGFGASNIPSELKTMTTTETLSFYSEFLYNGINYLFPKSKPIIISHSFGAFLSAKFYADYPTRIERLIFISGVGLLPTLDACGKYWGLLFKFGFPCNITKLFGRFLNITLFSLIPLNTENRFYYYWCISILTCSNNISDVICSKFIDFNMFNTKWNTPIIKELLCKNLNIDFISGANDTISPFHVLKLVQDISYITEKEPFDLYVIQNCNHNSFFNLCSNESFEVIKHIINKKNYDDFNFKNKYCMKIYKLDLLFNIINQFEGGSYDITTTSEIIQKFYNKILLLWGKKIPRIPFYVIQNSKIIKTNNISDNLLTLNLRELIF
jgi:pimeloyl-ACP methyl ester carboxylesterase